MVLLEKKLNPVYAEELTKLGVGTPEVRALGTRLLAQGPAALLLAERLRVLADAETMA